jgi:hypothetical protein
MIFRHAAKDRRRGESRRAEDRRRRLLRPALLELEGRKLLSTIVVNNPTDTPVTGEIDLRQAIEMANTDGGDETITFDRTIFRTAQTIELTSGQLELSNTSAPITIDGPGVGALTIDAGGKSRVFAIDPGVTASISGMTVTGGASGGAYVSGGDLYNQGTVTLSGATVRGGSAFQGGGLFNYGTATLVDCTLADNLGNQGAGLFNEGTVTLQDCTITGNTGVPAGGLWYSSIGGGLYNAGALSMTDGSITGNSATFGSALNNSIWAGVTNLAGVTIRANPGEGSYGEPNRTEMIYNGGYSLRLADCTISGDPAAPLGGPGILNFYSGRLDMVDCTVEGFANGGILNEDASSLSMSGCRIIDNAGWGGLANASGNATLTDCTISGNTVTGDGFEYRYGGGGVTNLRSATLAMTDCLVAGNQDVATPGRRLDSDGGAIFNGGTVTLTGCTMRDNIASGPGGALFNGGQATLTNCIVRGNSASDGGGIDNAGQLTATSVTLSGNSAETGGGIANAAGATATVSGSWIIHNTATGDGGGIANAGTLSLTGTLILANAAAGDGGGLYNSGTAALVDCLVAANSAASGGGIDAASGGTVTLTRTLVVGNRKDNIIGTVTYG